MNKAWAFTQMGIGRGFVQRIPGLKFWKMLGTGRGLGFSIKPDFGKYGFLGVWDSERHADDFLNSSTFMKQYKAHADDITTIKLIPIKADGMWSGQNPFIPVFQPEESYNQGKVAVLTRASIRLGSLKRFWQHVPNTSDALAEAPGLKFSIGLGETPFIHQATFSIWNSVEAMKNFAYQSPIHQAVIRKTRSENWYSEDLFARFLVLKDFF